MDLSKKSGRGVANACGKMNQESNRRSQKQLANARSCWTFFNWKSLPYGPENSSAHVEHIHRNCNRYRWPTKYTAGSHAITAFATVAAVRLRAQVGIVENCYSIIGGIDRWSRN